MAGVINDAKKMRPRRCNNCKVNNAGVGVPCGCWPHECIAGSIIATRDIRAGEELLYAYGSEYWEGIDAGLPPYSSH
jgi:SET domain-containing protein